MPDMWPYPRGTRAANLGQPKCVKPLRLKHSLLSPHQIEPSKTDIDDPDALLGHHVVPAWHPIISHE